LVGRVVLCVLFLVGTYFTSLIFVATIERVGAPSPLAVMTTNGSITPQASRRMDSICADALQTMPTAESLRYCGLAEMIARPGVAAAETAERYGRAVGYLEGSVNRSPFNGITWLYLAAANVAAGNMEAAAEAFDTSYEVSPIAVGMQGMRLGVGFSILDSLKPITLMSLESEILMLGARNPRYLVQLAKSSNRLRYVASTLTAEPKLFTRFMRIVREPPPGLRR
jgi:hypothetical protein